MIGVHQRFTPLQRLLHWLMAVCILAMLFIGIGMVSTTMPKYLPLVAIHKSLGIAILVLALIRLAVRLRYGAPALPADLPEPMKLAAHLSHYALYALMIGMPLLGWAMLSAAAYPVVVFGGPVASGDPAAERQSAYLALGRAFLSGFRVFRPGPDACRGGVVPCARSPRRRVRNDGVRVGVDPGRARARRVKE
jgi:cytochrome b561